MRMHSTYFRVKISTASQCNNTAKEVGKTIDPDVGGEHSFILDEQTNKLTATSYCNKEYYLSMLYLLNDPTQLYETVKLNAEKLCWISTSTIQDIFVFCNNTTIDLLEEKGEIH